MCAAYIACRVRSYKIGKKLQQFKKLMSSISQFAKEVLQAHLGRLQGILLHSAASTGFLIKLPNRPQIVAIGHVANVDSIWNYDRNIQRSKYIQRSTKA